MSSRSRVKVSSLPAVAPFKGLFEKYELRKKGKESYEFSDVVLTAVNEQYKSVDVSLSRNQFRKLVGDDYEDKLWKLYHGTTEDSTWRFPFGFLPEGTDESTRIRIRIKYSVGQMAPIRNRKENEEDENTYQLGAMVTVNFIPGTYSSFEANPPGITFKGESICLS